MNHKSGRFSGAAIEPGTAAMATCADEAAIYALLALVRAASTAACVKAVCEFVGTPDDVF